MSDTLYLPQLAEVLHGANLLYHESTFMHELLDRANETLHTTAKQAGMLAKAAGVKRLLLGHYSARYRDLTPLLFEAQKEFENTLLAIEGEKYIVD
jgi:ribonuclease Z